MTTLADQPAGEPAGIGDPAAGSVDETAPGRSAEPADVVDAHPGDVDLRDADLGDADIDGAEVDRQTGEEAAPVEEATPGGYRPRAVAVFAAVATLALLIDIVTKQLAVAHLREGTPVEVLNGVLYLVLTRNGGAAWSMGTSYTWVFPVITLAVIGWIGWMVMRLRSVPWAISLGLVLGGALGNFADRVFRAPGPFVGHVVDFLSVFSDTGQAFPIFNAADSSLVCGVFLAVALELTGRRRDGVRVRH